MIAGRAWKTQVRPNAMNREIASEDRAVTSGEYVR